MHPKHMTFCNGFIQKTDTSTLAIAYRDPNLVLITTRNHRRPNCKSNVI